MLQGGIRRALNLCDDVLGQHLAELHAPLVEGVNLPDSALGEDRMLVESDQLAQRFRCETLRQNYIRGPVALKDAVRNQPVRRSLDLDLLRRLAES